MDGEDLLLRVAKLVGLVGVDDFDVDHALGSAGIELVWGSLKRGYIWYREMEK